MKLLVIFMILLPNAIFSTNGRGIALGNVKASLLDEYSILGNPAGIARNNSSYVLLNVSNRYGIKALTEKYLAGAIVFKQKAIGLSFFQFGDHRLKKTDLSASYSQLFGEGFSLGLSMHAIQWAFADIYGTRLNAYSSLGCVVKVTEKSTLCCLIENLSRSFTKNSDNEGIDRGMSFGMIQKLSNKFNLRTEVEKIMMQNIGVKLGFEYKPQNNLILRSGFETGNLRCSLGLQFSVKWLEFDLAFSYETMPGFRTSLGFIHRFEHFST